MSLIRKHVAVLQAWACLALVFVNFYCTRRRGAANGVLRGAVENPRMAQGAHDSWIKRPRMSFERVFVH